MDFWCWEGPLYQLSHNHCPEVGKACMDFSHQKLHLQCIICCLITYYVSLDIVSMKIRQAWVWISTLSYCYLGLLQCDMTQPPGCHSKTEVIEPKPTPYRGYWYIRSSSVVRSSFILKGSSVHLSRHHHRPQSVWVFEEDQGGSVAISRSKFVGKWLFGYKKWRRVG